MISFMLNDTSVTIENPDANTTVQQYVRNTAGLTGTKEGCGSGDCGACTLVVAEPDTSGKRLQYSSTNSCITLLSSLHGKQLITPEFLAENQALHPVQQAMVDNHGSQCGYCTPGFIMSMFAFYKSGRDADKHNIERALSGNLCRCTGYRPIIDATVQACELKNKTDKFSSEEQRTLELLDNLISSSAEENSLSVPYQPANRAELRQALASMPEAKLVAGGTDLVLEITQQLKQFEKLIDVSRVAEMTEINVHPDGLEIGAALPISTFSPVLLAHFPQLADLIERFASDPVRNRATLGGNIANASPIGDFPPVMLALGATVNIDDGIQVSSVPINQFFTGYRTTRLEDKQWISSIFIPFLEEGSHFEAYKVSKRKEDDISAVCLAIKITCKDDEITDVSTGVGGVAATPVIASCFASQLLGKRLSDEQTRIIGAQLLVREFNPIDDVRASANYRKTLLANLWSRFWYTHNQPDITIRIV